jgi:ectoine hydroxylase-related dioxygenase (phytanoyl-CoA dioxygenase family)
LQAEIFLPKKGDILIWHGNLIHEGSKVRNAARTRKSYAIHYTSHEAYPREHRWPDDHGFSENGGCMFEYPWLNAKRNKLPSWRE